MDPGGECSPIGKNIGVNEKSIKPFRHYCIPHLVIDPSTKLRKNIYKNISKSRLHREASRTLVLPCPDVIEWISRRVDHESKTIINFEDKNVSSYQALVLNLLYHFKEADVKVTLEWLKKNNDSTYFLLIMKGWWSEGQLRENPLSVEWKTSTFIKSIQIIVIFSR
jgi:hypothetical protein